MAETWGDVFQSALAKGCDHASAATRANDWERRRAKAVSAASRAATIEARGKLHDLLCLPAHEVGEVARQWAREAYDLLLPLAEGEHRNERKA